MNAGEIIGGAIVAVAVGSQVIARAIRRSVKTEMTAVRASAVEHLSARVPLTIAHDSPRAVAVARERSGGGHAALQPLAVRPPLRMLHALPPRSATAPRSPLTPDV